MDMDMDIEMDPDMEMDTGKDVNRLHIHDQKVALSALNLFFIY
jgi:hypothetical protein